MTSPDPRSGDAPRPRGRLLGKRASQAPPAASPAPPAPPELRPPEFAPAELGEPPEFEVVGGAPPAKRPLPLEVWHVLREDANGWCRGKLWEVRLPVLLFFVYILARSLLEEEYTNFFFGGINLAFHEMGHALFRFFGEFMMIAGGTILQCLVPLIAAFAFWRSQRDYFGVAFSLGWFGTNAFGCAIYASDARGQRNLPLVSPWGQSFGRDGNGDWTRMLSKLNMLEWDTTIAFCFNLAGVLAFLLALALGGWLLWRMHASRSEPKPPPPEWAT